MPDIKVDIERSVWGSDKLLPLLYLNYEHFVNEPETDDPYEYDMGVRIIFSWQGYVVNALMFGSYDQAGMLTLGDFTAEVAITDTSVSLDDADIVAYAARLFRAYVAAQDDPDAPLEDHDGLTLSDLSIDYPHNVG